MQENFKNDFLSQSLKSKLQVSTGAVYVQRKMKKSASPRKMKIISNSRNLAFCLLISAKNKNYFKF